MNFTDYQMISSLNELFQGFNINARCVDARAHRHFAFYDVDFQNEKTYGIYLMIKEAF